MQVEHMCRHRRVVSRGKADGLEVTTSWKIRTETWLHKHARQTILHRASTASDVQLLLKEMKSVEALRPP